MVKIENTLSCYITTKEIAQCLNLELEQINNVVVETIKDLVKINKNKYYSDENHYSDDYVYADYNFSTNSWFLDKNFMYQIITNFEHKDIEPILTFWYKKELKTDLEYFEEYYNSESSTDLL